MKLIRDNLPEQNVDTNGSVEIVMDGYYYHIGELDGTPWISRMTIQDYEDGLDNWERVNSWIPENKPTFRLLRGDELT